MYEYVDADGTMATRVVPLCLANKHTTHVDRSSFSLSRALGLRCFLTCSYEMKRFTLYGFYVAYMSPLRLTYLLTYGAEHFLRSCRNWPQISIWDLTTSFFSRTSSKKTQILIVMKIRWVWCGDTDTVRPWTLLLSEPGQRRAEKVEVTGYRNESGSPHMTVDIVVNFLEKYLLVSWIVM
jgi:hypothetical protein